MQMYALHRLCASSQAFLDSFIGSNRAKSDAFSLALASVLVNSLILTKDCDVNGLFTKSCEQKFLAALSRLNEMIRLDASKVLDYAAKLNRYHLSKNEQRIGSRLIHSDETAVEDFFGISDAFSSTDLITIKQNARQIAVDVNRLSTLFNDMRLLNDGQ